MIAKDLKIDKLELECGDTLMNVNIRFHHKEGKGPNSKVIWVFHALTANSNAMDWWKDLLKDVDWINQNDEIFCVNILGSCYGTSWESALNDKFENVALPLITVKDNIALFEAVANHFKINEIDIAIGGSLGGSQLLEWSIEKPERIKKAIFLACSAKESTWAKAAHYAQRRAIEEDENFKSGHYDKAFDGVKIARNIGMLTYRSQECFDVLQGDSDERYEDFKIESYLKYHEQKFLERFTSDSYYILSKCLDTHNVGRNRKGLKKALNSIKAQSLIIGISSDLLCPTVDQEFLSEHIINSKLSIIQSLYGHDGFLVEAEKINKEISKFLKNE